MQHDDLLIGFDLGTSAIKAILTDTEGNLISRASRQVSFIRPASDRCEIDPDVYYNDVVAILKDLADASPEPNRIRALSFCAASGNTILLDANHQPVMNTISWLDHRAAEIAAERWPEIDATSVYRKVGWPWNGGFPLAHLAWIRDFQPETWANARYLAMNNDYLYYRLCGKLVVDPSKATTFFLRDQAKGIWNQKLLDFLGADESMLPAILPSGSLAGNLTDDVCAVTGLSPNTVVAAGSFDHPSAARSTGVFEEGDLLISAGTSWVAFTPLRDRQTGLDNRMLVDPFMSPSGCWGGMLSLTAVADRIDTLLVSRFGDVDDLYKRFDELAMDSPPGARGCMLDPWKQSVEEISDLTTDVSDSSYCRAIMEGCAFLLVSRLRAVEKALESGIRRTVMVGGPTNSPIWPKILAASVGSTLEIPESNAHAGALGAAIMAGIGAGIFNDVSEGQKRMNSAVSVLKPRADEIAEYRSLYRKYAQKYDLQV